jgi:hypothetical protein
MPRSWPQTQRLTAILITSIDVCNRFLQENKKIGEELVHYS